MTLPLRDAGMVIIGAGECGARAAVTLREQGWTGSIVVVGNESHLPYERPPLSKSYLTTVSLAHKPNADAARFDELGIEFKALSKVVSIEREDQLVTLDDGASLGYHRLLLATGAKARRVTVDGADHVICLRTVDDAGRIRAALGRGKRLAIIGGGLIGMELAASAVAMGCRVAVVERQPRILCRSVPASPAAVIEARHRSAGVEFIFGAELLSIAAVGDGFDVATTTKTIEANVVVAGIGATPVTALAEGCNLDVDNGIATDSFLCTADKAIFAAGDCASTIHPLFADMRLRLESWRNALEQGERAARNMLGQRVPQQSVPWFWSDQYELCLQVAGLPNLASSVVERNLNDEATINFHLDDSGIVVGASAVGLLETIAKDMRVAEMLIARRACPDPILLAQADHRLRSFLAA